ncbi:hypothetical protein RB195_024735 [Necator americanus]|uniref:Rab-GAP TBC domain-containing protein n=1 Tax=Necator americanus TaxID=51031 RepID=A0ABR1EPP2_NECAM
MEPTDTSTETPLLRCCDTGISNPYVDVLARMEQLNRSSEEDTRSMASQKSASSGSPKGHEPSLAEDDEEDLWGVWGEVIHKWEVEVKKNPSSIKTLVKRGIPQHFRTIAWQLLSNASVSSIHEVYSDYMRQSSIYEKVIQRDIPRTYPELEFFKDGGRGQASLFNVMKAYSIHDKEVGYCQGSAFIVGLLLLQMPEEEAFAVLVRLMENYRLRELYKPAMTDLGLCMFQLECLVQEQKPTTKVPDIAVTLRSTLLRISTGQSSMLLNGGEIREEIGGTVKRVPADSPRMPPRHNVPSGYAGGYASIPRRGHAPVVHEDADDRLRCSSSQRGAENCGVTRKYAKKSGMSSDIAFRKPRNLTKS